MARTPRFNPYVRLLHRLFESLYMIHALGRVRGPRQVANLDLSTVLGTRRRFLSNLAFLSDYTKGGHSTAALAVEDAPGHTVFWLATNEGVSEASLDFLRSVIEAVKSYNTQADRALAEAEQDLVVRCITFASKRVKKQAKGLESSVRLCEDDLAGRVTDGEGLVRWLKGFKISRFRDADLAAICQHSYQVRKDPQMDTIVRLARPPGRGDLPVPEHLIKAFRKIRHTIGRLGAYNRAVKELLEDGPRLEFMLDGFEIRPVPRPDPVPKPGADDHTNLEGVLRRLFRAKDPRSRLALDYLTDLDRQGEMDQGLQDFLSYGDESLRVHAEVQMLHHFNDQPRRFLGNDAYVAVSKPACLCCKLYFRHHQAGCVELDSHEKIYLNWSPPYLAKAQLSPQWDEQRHSLTALVQDIGKEVAKEIDRRRLPTRWADHPDSQTGITGSFIALEGESTSDDEDADSGSAQGYSSADSCSDSDGGAQTLT